MAGCAGSTAGDRSLLSIVIPTIAGREDQLDRTIARYNALTRVGIEWLIERDHPTCGAAWNAGAAKATSEVLHISADDLEPEAPDWLNAAARVLEAGFAPLGLVREDELGTFGGDFCRVPICLRDWWVDVPADLHYYTDNAFTDLMGASGHPPLIAEGYDFYHRRSMVGRGAGMEEGDRVQHDWTIYSRGV